MRGIAKLPSRYRKIRKIRYKLPLKHRMFLEFMAINKSASNLSGSV